MSKVFAYIRVSSIGQCIDRQINEIKKAGHDLPQSQIYVDRQSGANRDREQLNALLASVQYGDVIVCASIDRLARSTLDVLNITQELSDRGVGLTIIGNTTLSFEPNGAITPEQRAMLTVMAAVATLERDLIKERQKQGIEAAQAQGKHMGRPKTQLTKEQALAAVAECDGNKSQAAKLLGVGRATFYRVLSA